MAASGFKIDQSETRGLARPSCMGQSLPNASSFRCDDRMRRPAPKTLQGLFST